MKVSLNWLKEYLPGVNFPPVSGLMPELVNIGLDVESVEDLGSKFNGFVVGKVLEKQKHPNADKLSVCKVDVGGDVLQIVCGAPNVEAGQKVCVALVGSVIPIGNFEIKKAKLRGESSEGMICSVKELELGEDHSGILVLDENAAIGESFAAHMGYNDVVMDIWVAPNRGDTACHFGMAREFGTVFNTKITKPEIKLDESKPASSSYIKVTLENNKDCKRFTGRVVKNVKIAESPDWLKQRLTAVGLRPKNNIVDITNFVMLETGQPLHAFDMDKIRGSHIIVKSAKEGDKFTTLDGKERILNSGSLMICDADGYTGIAGVMGGQISEISDDTKNVFIESAWFDPVCIRKNAKKLGMMTDASQRFEKGVDIDNVPYASNRAAMLMQQLASGEIAEGIIDSYPKPFEKISISLNIEKATRLIGLELSKDDIIKSLAKEEIEFTGSDKKGILTFSIPEHRRYDLEREVDLIEEVIRMYGFDKLKPENRNYIDLSAINLSGQSIFDKQKLVKNYFIGRGFNEIQTRSQLQEDIVKKFSGNYVAIENPFSSEANVMRQNLIVGMLNVIKQNIHLSGKENSFKLFETGRVFEKDGNEINESVDLCVSITGLFDQKSFDTKTRTFDFYDLKGEIEMFLLKLNIENFEFIDYNSHSSFTAASAMVVSNSNNIGKLHILHKDLLELFEIDIPVFIAEIHLTRLWKQQVKPKAYSAVSRFPVVKRDLALVVNDDIPYAELYKKIKSSSDDTLKHIELFDIYRGDKIGSNKKSLAFSLQFNSTAETLTDEKVNKKVEKIISQLKSEFDASLRS